MNKTAFRTHTCNELTAANVGEKVVLSGFVHTKRDHGGLLFLDLRDHYGITQCVCQESDAAFAVAEKLKDESIINLAGRVVARSKETVNSNMLTGEVEVCIDELSVLSAPASQLPVQINVDNVFPEDTRLTYRYLDLRRTEIHNNIILRSNIIAFLRKEMINSGFLEIQTPILTSSSPEGARDYLVPSRVHPGKFYALPQAPQQFKQLLMVAGFDKYFQIAPCFRDEDSRADRSPGEFYQLDFEMSFVSQDDVFAAIEPVIHNTFVNFAPKGFSVSPFPFRRISYADSLLHFGSDKPDLRNPLLIQDVTTVFEKSDFGAFVSAINSGSKVRSINVPGCSKEPRSFFEKLNDWAKDLGLPGLGYITMASDSEFSGPIAKFLKPEELSDIKKINSMSVGDVVFFVCDKNAEKLAGAIRTKLGTILNLINQKEYNFCWIVDFPMFEYDEDAKIDLKLKNAIIKALKVVLNDNSRIKASFGTKVDNIYTFEHANYTPCKESNCSLPLWDLDAEKVIYDAEKKALIYHNVKLRMKGKPIAFLPYMKHPAFGLKRQTGFLVPMISSDNATGLFVGVPYFVELGKDKDLKLTPFLNTKNRAFMAARYRQSMANADFRLAGSFLSKTENSPKISDEDKRHRWHIDMFFQSHNIENKRVTLKIDRASDVIYKQKYPVTNQHFGGLLKGKTNESALAFDFFDENYFATVDSHVFQTPEQNTAPVIIPHFNLNYRQNNAFQGIAEINSDILCLSRDEAKLPKTANQLFRTSNEFIWKNDVPISNFLIGFSSGARIDTYYYRKAENRRNKVYPMLENQVSCFLPLTSTFLSEHKSIWGPKIVISSIKSANSRRKFEVNEDAVFNSINDLNLYKLNRFGAVDDAEIGEKLTAGIENSFYNSERRFLNFFIGKSQKIGNLSGNEKNRDETVGRIILKPTDILSIRTRLVGLPCTEKLKMLEAGASVDINKFSCDLGYIYDARPNAVREKRVSQLGASFGFKISKFWNVSLSQIFNMAKWMGSRNLTRGLFLTYKDECFSFGLGLYKAKYKFNNGSQKTGFIISIIFKNLANIGGKISSKIYKTNMSKVE
ncbi:hypothetical protein FACS1894113_0720 [Alphaproteobacteria bacterium]|nr:hypothetical protein FACS1894113_0720 [Alphaproteobacteria bacterium]